MYDRAEVAELADAHGSGPCTRKGVGVRVPPSAPNILTDNPCLPSLSRFSRIPCTKYGPARRRQYLASPAQSRRPLSPRIRGCPAQGCRLGPAIIAELKKASPSRGLIRPDFDPAALAHSLQAAGAAALSVLTNDKYFQGSLGNLSLASAAVSIPCLRKDFILDPFQILEARAAGADAILLIVAARTDANLEKPARRSLQHATRCPLRGA